MKRTNIRVRRNGTKRAGIAQASKESTSPNVIAYQRRGERGANQPSTKPASAVMLEFQAGREVISRAEISGETFRRMEDAANVAGQPVAKFILEGIAGKLRQMETVAGESVTLVFFLQSGEGWAQIELSGTLFMRLLMAAGARRDRKSVV